VIFEFTFLFRERAQPSCYYTNWQRVEAESLQDAWRSINIRLVHQHTNPGDLVQINFNGIYK